MSPTKKIFGRAEDGCEGKNCGENCGGCEARCKNSAASSQKPGLRPGMGGLRAVGDGGGTYQIKYNGISCLEEVSWSLRRDGDQK